MLFDILFNLLPLDLQIKMKQTPQDRLFHSEGSVYNHSRLVASKLPDELNYQACALIHDLGKLDCIQFNEKQDKIRIQSIGHDDSRFVSKYIDIFKNILIDKSELDLFFAIDFYLIYQVCTYHMRMHKYLNNGITKPTKRKFMEELIYFEELKVFAKADSEGRIVDPAIAPPYLICTVGIPGSGKSYWAKEFSNKSNYKIICPDTIRAELSNGDPSSQEHNKQVWELSYHRLKDLLEKKECVIFDSTLCNLSTLKSLITISKDKKAIIMFKIFDTSIEICKQRIKEDIDNKIIRSNVPEIIIDNMNIKFPSVVSYIKEENYFIIKN